MVEAGTLHITSPVLIHNLFGHPYMVFFGVMHKIIVRKILR